ncbi:MAG: CotH kinase family protein, partial [Chitinophagales bacterium]|nr:CotH kinase family protein [Chitinophagales bacterium]
MNVRLLFFLCFFAYCSTSFLQAQVVINEFSAANYAGVTDNFGENEDWVELYNNSGAAVNLSNWHLSDDPTDPTKWTFPSGTNIPNNGFLRVWCSGQNTGTGNSMHTNFKITQTKGSEAILISNAAGTVIDINNIDIPNQTEHSWGRSPNGSNNWRVFTTPTPNASNNGANYAGYTPTPNVIPASGSYGGTVSVSIACPDATATIRYTNNGDFPTGTATLYNNAFNVTQTRVIRAFAQSADANYLPSYVETNTYFINVAPHTCKIISLAGAGLTTLLGGNNSAPRGSYELFDESFTKLDEGYGEFNKHGNDSWAYQQRGIDLIARDQFGYDYAVREQVFPTTPRDRFQRLILKPAANDNYPFEDGAYLRDAYVHTLSQRASLQLDERTWEPAVLYVNGQYWGIYEIREKVDDSDYTDFYYNKDGNQIDFIKTWGGTWAEYGDMAQWNAIYSYIMANNMANASNYAYVESQFNVMSLIDYVIINTQTVCSDWLNWNTAWWHSNNSDVKWRYALWDMDATFDHYINYTSIPDQSATASPCGPSAPSVDDPEGHIALLTKLMENDHVRDMYINRYADLNNTYFSCEYMVALLDSMYNELSPEMPRQVARWGGTVNGWQQNVIEMRDFILERCSYINEGIADCTPATGPYTIVFTVNDPNGGTISIDDYITPSSYPWTGEYFGNTDLPLTATANDGYQFAYWEVNNTIVSNLNDPSIIANLTANDTITAYFSPATVQLTVVVSPNGAGTITINGNTINNYPQTFTVPFNQLLNISAAPSSNCYTFSHWTLTNNPPLTNPNNNNNSFNIVATGTLTAVFTPITPPNCDDNNCGTTDTYNTTTCQCEHTPITPPNCNDNNCGTDDTYNTMTCQCEHTPITPPNCNDNNCGTTDTYNTTTCQCEHTPITPPNCDDNNCGTTDTYNTTTCQCEHTPITPPNCDDNNCGTTDTYNTMTCQCEHTPITPPNCDDNLCGTDDSYNTTTCECEHTPIVPPNCDDNLCGTDDSYNATTCQCEHTPIVPPNCDDNLCGTDDSYNSTTCECEHTPIIPPNCDDNLCGTTDVYNATTCECEHIPITPPDCNDNNCNTADVYNFATCACENNPISPTACDDGLCSTDDSYNTATCECEHTPIVPPNCDDNLCGTDDSYNTTTCECEHTPIVPPNCDDNNCGTTDTYNTTTCECEHTPIVPPNCDDNLCGTDDSYNAATCECEHTPIVPPNCDDNLCGTTDVYNTATCQCEHTPITPPDCNDNNCNTADVYNFAACACENNPISPTACDDGLCGTTDNYNTATCQCEHTP